MLRVAVVGARCRRQGTGEYVARELGRAGCRVEALVGTSEATVRQARETLDRRYGIRCRGYLSLAELLDAEAVDAVAICSPPEHHREHLELALAAGCHIFCEKPLWWDDALARASAAAVRARAQELVDRCAENRRILTLNTQWPYTLDAFRQLHPNAPSGPLERFSMWLAPVSTGSRAVVDSAPHLLSMLYALAGPGTVVGPAVSQRRRAEELALSFTYEHREGTAEVDLLLRQCPSVPRPAGYRINGRAMERRIELPGYRISFVAGGRSMGIRDPLATSVERFVAAMRSEDRTRRASLVAGMAHLHQLVMTVERSG